jgi:hypothetical protein
MPERTPSEQLWADFERQLLALPHEHLAKVCAHLIRTYIIESRSPARAVTGSVVPTPSEQAVPPATVTSQPSAASTRAPEHPPATTPPEPKPVKDPKDKKYNKLEMD